MPNHSYLLLVEPDDSESERLIEWLVYRKAVRVIDGSWLLSDPHPFAGDVVHSIEVEIKFSGGLVVLALADDWSHRGTLKAAADAWLRENLSP